MLKYTGIAHKYIRFIMRTKRVGFPVTLNYILIDVYEYI